MYNKLESLTRQFDLIPMEALDKSITIIGAGAVGGWTALSLAKMGFQNITVYDFDHVDTVNLNSQLYRYKDIKKPKVQALQEIIKDFTDITITAANHAYAGNLLSTDILIAAVDSMEVRKMIWDANKNFGMVKTFVDPRMGAETALLYVMRPGDSKDKESYEKTLYSDANAVAEPCTSKSTSYCAMGLSGLVCAQVKSVTTGNSYSRITQWNIPGGALNSWASK